jgi:hypothetical protein
VTDVQTALATLRTALTWTPDDHRAYLGVDAAFATVEQALTDKDRSITTIIKEDSVVVTRQAAEIVRLTAERDEARAVRNVHSEARRNAEAEVARLRGALREIVRCDYRGNMPREQSIARAALGKDTT